MARIDLSELSWTLRGWRPYYWRLVQSVEAATQLETDVGPVPARVPGSVQQALLEAGIIEDWHVGTNSRRCEWVEHRHWQFTAELPALEVQGPIVLDAQGLDYSGWMLIDGKEAGTFSGALLPHRFDLTAFVNDGQPHRLSIVFDEPPPEQGQFGYTSRSRHFKPRYNYSWDWCPRFVPIGVWDSLTVRTGLDAVIDLERLCADLRSDAASGLVEAVVRCAAPAPEATLSLELSDGGHAMASTSAQVEASSVALQVIAEGIQPWWPNGMGAQKLYNATVRLLDRNGAELWKESRRIGFKRVEWHPCEGAPADAEPWLCVVNGRPVFLQGVNWTPVRVAYHDTDPREYERLAGLYRDMGCNLLRVWGGAYLEKTDFYNACDEAGLLVWQEFPLSSSGCENEPPSGPAAVENLLGIARSYIRRRRHHVSLLMWCGGNELLKLPEGRAEGMGAPADYSYPAIAAMRDLVRDEDPGRRFVPTSPSGPRSWGTREDWGRGVHHDVHGPWGMGGFRDKDDWRDYWAHDDALFRSEVGMPGAADLESIMRHCGGQGVWPPDGEYWRHTAAWWTQWDRVRGQLKGKGLAEYVELTQREQGEAYAVAAAACKGRFPRCGGFLVWMGHDCFPCPANNSLIDFDKNPKPAYSALREVFTGLR